MAVGIIASNVASMTIIDVSLTPAQVNSVVAPAQTFTVPGLLTTDAVMVNPPSQTAGVAIANCYVSAANTLSIQFVNPTAGALTPAAGTHRVTVFRAEGNSRAGRVLT